MKIAYDSKRFGADRLAKIRQANRILEEYAEQGYDLTLRQLFYQHVARGLIPNTERSYKQLGTLINDARMCGMTDWDYIVDRTRNLRAVTHWRDPAHIIGATAHSFRVDLWDEQGDYVEVWIEKDALIGVITGVCRELDVPYFSCRGYTSQSEMWAASQRLLKRVIEGKTVTILHLGDHDPSGIDMSRDIEDRLTLFIAYDYARHVARERGMALADLDPDEANAIAREGAERLNLRRIALTMDQIEQYDPPPNPAKVSDSRAVGYIERYGGESWELDALEPTVLTELVREHVEGLVDDEALGRALARQEEGQELLERASREWARIAASLNGADEED